jgi:photosystem II stability/assembly factor-like uncharacterized protein
MSAQAMQQATDTRRTALRRWGRRSRALLAVVGSLLIGVAPAVAAAGRWVPLGPFGAPVVSLAVTPEAPQVLYAGATNGLFKSAGAAAGSTALRFEALPLDHFVTAIVVVPSDPPAVLAATDSGIFRSADGGSTWQENGGQQVFGVELQALALDPRDPTVVYAGAGLTGDGGTSSGLFKSTDAGLTFEAADLGIERTVVSSIVVDPFDSRTVYAASPQPSNLVSTPQPNGVFKSTDGGATWQVKNQGLRLPAAKDERFGLQTGVIQVAVDPETAGTLYAVVGYSGELYRSRDGAESWQQLPTGFAAATVVVGRHGVLYLGGALPGQPPAVFKSVDGGRHWRRTAAPSSATLLAPPSEPSAGRGGVAADDVLYAASGGGLARSTDGGASWQVFDAGMSLLAIDHLAASSGTVYAVAGADLYRGNSFGSAWHLAFPQANSAPSSTITDLAVDPRNPSRLFAAVDGRLISSRTAGRRWRDVALPDETCNQLTNVAVAPSDGLTVYAGGSPLSGIGDNPPPCSGGCQTFHSRDGGATWECLPLTNVTRFVVDPSDPETVYAFGPALPGVTLDCDFAKSSDGGRTWQPLRPGGFGFGIGFSLLAIDPAAPRHLYTVLDRTLWESLDGGQTWATKGPGIPSFPILFPSPVAALLVDPRNSAVLYASVDPVGVLRSTNGGLSWRLLSGGLPSGVLDAAGPLAIDPSQPDLLFLGTGDRGVFRLRQ